MVSPSTGVEALLDQLRFRKSSVPEKNLFSLGARRYFENPTTDLLSFYLDPMQVHGLADLVLSSFLGCIPRSGHGRECCNSLLSGST